MISFANKIKNSIGDEFVGKKFYMVKRIATILVLVKE